MDTCQLKTFLEVSRTRHFGQAAHNLFLSQSAVSSRIKALEDQLGTPLFVRIRNDIQLTPAGSRLLSHAENILAAWGRAQHDVAIEEEKSSSLAIAATPSLWDITLRDWLYDVHNTLPSISIHGEMLDVDTIVRRIMEGTLDIGFTFEPPQLPQIQVESVGSIALVMVSSQADLTSAEALNFNYVSVDWGATFAISHARHFPEFQSPTIRLPLGRIAYDYLLGCGGTAYLAEPTVRKALAEGRLYQVADAPVIERTAYALYSNTPQPPESVKTALSLFK